MRILLYCLFACFPIVRLLAQEDIPVGTWRMHLTYHNAHALALAGDKVFVASKNGLFYYSKADASLRTLTKIDGLSDTGIAQLAYHEASKQLAIAYSNGNIDLLGEEGITNVRTLLNSQASDKRIFSIAAFGQSLFLATGFGGMEFDMRQLVAKDIYRNLGAPGKQIAVTADSIYLLTNEGLYAVSRQASVNRQDWKQWRLINAPFLIKQIAVAGTELYALASNGQVFLYENGNWQAVSAMAEGIQAIISDKQKLTGLGKGTAITEEGQRIISHPDELSDIQALAEDEGTYWLVDGQSGLVRQKEGELLKLIPSGPFSSQAFRLHAYGGKVLAVSGGYQGSMAPYYRTTGFYVFDNGIWENYTPEANSIGAAPIPDMADWSCAASRGNSAYIGTYGHGILLWEGDGFSTALNTEASPKFITDMGFDSQGALWVASSDKGLYVWKDAAWSFALPLSRPTRMIVDALDNKWIALRDGNVRLLAPNGSQRLLQHAEGNGNLRGGRALSLAENADGNVWIGTDNGITDFFDSFFALQGNDGTAIYGAAGIPLNQGEAITALAIDAGNRKWVGTANGGVWLYSKSYEPLAHFTAQNSPLLSNAIIDIAIDPSSGEVFFATDKGIASYRSDATQAPANAAAAKIFPNPVLPDFDGLVAIEGIAQNAFVWIADAAGQVVWKGRANGGTASWNLRDYSGRKAASGQYLVFAALPDGTQAIVGQLVVVAD